MNDGHAQEFASALGGLAETFGEPLSAGRIDGYFLALKDLPMEAVLASIARAMRSSRFFPKPAELREFIEGTGDDLAALAWTRVIRAIERIGTYQSVDFGDPVLHATVDGLGGWSEFWRIERMDAREQGFKRAEFVRLYGALRSRGVEDAPRRLLGQHEVANRERGYLGKDETLVIGPGGSIKALPAPLNAVPSESEATP